MGGLRAVILGARRRAIVAKQIDRPDAFPKEEAPADGGGLAGASGFHLGEPNDGRGNPHHCPLDNI